MERKIKESTKPKNDAPKEVKRFYKGEETVDSDLFKLEVSYFKKKISHDGERRARYENAEHCHFFHTYDSNGRTMEKASSVGGHTHTVKWEIRDGEFFAACSPPIATNAFKKGAFQDGKDNHTHKMSYIRSAKIEKTVMSEKGKRVIDGYVKEFIGSEKI